MESEGPYRYAHSDEQKAFVVVGPGWETMGGTYTKNEADIGARFASLGYAEGRKAAENYTEKMLVFAKDEVRKCHEEIRRLEDKYARNVYKMPPYNPSFDEKEHSELVDKGTNAWAGLVDEKGPTEKDFKELLELAEYVVDRIGDSGPFGQMHALEKFRAWKKARGIE